MSAKREFHFQIYKHVRKCQTAQSLVEFALTLPLLLLILLGAVDLGRVSNDYVAITNASREGARYGSSHPGRSELELSNIRSRVKQEAAGSGVTISDPDKNIIIQCFPLAGGSAYPSCGDAFQGDRIQVTVLVDFEFLTLYLLRVPSIPLSTSTTMVLIEGKVKPQ